MDWEVGPQRIRKEINIFCAKKSYITDCVDHIKVGHWITSYTTTLPPPTLEKSHLCQRGSLDYSARQGVQTRFVLLKGSKTVRWVVN